MQKKVSEWIEFNSIEGKYVKNQTKPWDLKHGLTMNIQGLSDSYKLEI